MTQAKRHHYVPQFLLRRFEHTPKSEEIYVFDKQAGRSFSARVGRVAAEKGFYDLRHEDHVLTYEPALAELDGRAASVINSVLERGEVGFLDPRSRALLAQFVVVQIFRTRQFREGVGALSRLVVESLDEDGPCTARRLGLAAADEERKREHAIGFIEESEVLADWVEMKDWVFYEAPDSTPFWIGDSPVALNNTLNGSDAGGTLGLAVPGIEIYLPISPHACLGFLCPTIRSAFEEAYETSAAIRDHTGTAPEDHEEIGAVVDGLRHGFPIPLKEGHVTFLRSLEALWAERFVFSSQQEFSMVREMVAEDPAVMRGPRPRLG